jgi:hypothetical protein
MTTSQIDGEILQQLPWVAQTFEGAAALINTGINVEVVIFMVVCVPILMRALQLAGLYVRTHNMDLRETIRVESLRQRLALRREYGQLYEEEQVGDSRLMLELDGESDK